MCKALGIVNLRKDYIDGLGDYRPIGATSFLGRYRIVDFILSNMANSKIDNIYIFIKDKPRSLIDHISGPRQYNMNSKRGKIKLLGMEKFAPDAYDTDIKAFFENEQFIDEVDLPYVIIAPCNAIYTIDFNEVLKAHMASEADITMIYKTCTNSDVKYLGNDHLVLNRSKEVLSIEENLGGVKNKNIFTETYVMSKEIFKKLITEARNTSKFYTLRDIVVEKCDNLKIMGYPYKGYFAYINSLQSYYDANMDLKSSEDNDILDNPDWPIYTRTNDSCPTKYLDEAIVSNSCIANGSLIKGTVINSVIGRNTIVEKNAVVKDCVILADTYIGPGTHVEKSVIDKRVSIKHKLCIKGETDNVLYIKKYDTV